MPKTGFTLIEIIIVVTIIGILAVSLLVAIDPVEQINRATDSTTVSLARDFTSATNQFQTNKSYSAACPDSSCASYEDALSTSSTVALSTLTAVNAGLEAEGATNGPANFTSHGQAARIQVSLTAASEPKNATFVLCWQPKSKFLKSQAIVTDSSSTIYDSQGEAQPPALCPADSTNTCYRCMRQ